MENRIYLLINIIDKKLEYGDDMKISKSEMEKKFKEEFSRQLLLKFYYEKYMDSYLSERPDIKNDRLSIGVEVTSSLKEEIYRDIFLERKRKKDISNFKNEYNKEIKFDDLYNIDNIKKFNINGDTNNLINSYSDKIEKMKKYGYTFYIENNLFINSRLADRDDIERFVNHISYKKKEEFDFDNIYIFTDIDDEQLILIDRKTLNIEVHTLKREDRDIIERITMENINRLL